MSECAQTGSTGAGGKHPRTVYSHCNERMLLIMKKEDGSSLRRTHPHITRSDQKGLVVIVASPACVTDTSNSPCSAKNGANSHPQILTPESYTLNMAILGDWTSSPSIITPILFWYELRTDCVEGGKHVHLPFSYASAIAPTASVA